jgi:hypothetical protein
MRPKPRNTLPRLIERDDIAAIALFLAFTIALSGCAALSSALGLAGPAVGAGLGAYEAEVQRAAAAKGIPSSDPRVLAAVADARKLAEKRAAEDKARDEAEARAVAEIKARLDARPCLAVDAGAADAQVGAP